MKSIRNMTKLLFLILFLISSIGFTQTEDIVEQDGVFIHLSSGKENPHKVLMALTLALKMSVDKDVFIFTDINGVDIVLKNSKSITFDEFESSTVLIAKLLEKGVTIEVCPMCLKVAGKTKYDLISGVKIAEKDDFFNFTNGRILTLDY